MNRTGEPANRRTGEEAVTHRRTGAPANRRNTLLDVSPHRRLAGAPVLFLLFLAGCVSLSPEMLPQTSPNAQPAASSYTGVESNGVSYSSLHFTLSGYSETELRSIAGSAETVFDKLGRDTGLYSYLANQNFTLVVYKDSQEYLSKTKLSSPSRAVAAGEAIYTYPGPDLMPVIAHHLTHLVMRSYLGEKAGTLQWLTEGLALSEEVEWMLEAERINFHNLQTSRLRTERAPFSQMIFFVGSNEDRRHEEVWYLQVESVVSYLLKQGTSLTFTAFLNALKNGAEIDQALANSYPGKFRNLADLETSWLAGS